MTTLSGVRTRRHRLLVGGKWSDAAAGETTFLTSPATGDAVAEVAVAGLPFGRWAGKRSGRGRVGGRHIFEAMTQIRSVAFDVGRGPS